MTKREIAENETKNDLEKTLPHLLTDIHDESLDRTRPGTETVSRTMARFAALLVRLSRNADDASEKNIKLAESVNRLTQIILVFTIVMAVLGGIQAYYSYKSYNLQASQTAPASPSPAQGK